MLPRIAIDARQQIGLAAWRNRTRNGRQRPAKARLLYCTTAIRSNIFRFSVGISKAAHSMPQPLLKHAATAGDLLLNLGHSTQRTKVGMSHRMPAKCNQPAGLHLLHLVPGEQFMPLPTASVCFSDQARYRKDSERNLQSASDWQCPIIIISVTIIKGQSQQWTLVATRRRPPVLESKSRQPTN